VRNVFKFYLQPVEMKAFNKEIVLQHTRLIPTSVKVEVWSRDKGQCVICGSKENLHYDHELPYSKGGTSLTAANVRILCMKHNLNKSNKILTIPPVFFS
jgi:5-methylcytosine-specific restriction endonuclease McrA